eukprot:9170517-Lingulodinium_polyedra.AAC.1
MLDACPRQRPIHAQMPRQMLGWVLLGRCLTAAYFEMQPTPPQRGATHSRADDARTPQNAARTARAR